MTKQCEVIELNDILKRMGENCIERVKKNRINKNYIYHIFWFGNLQIYVWNIYRENDVGYCYTITDTLDKRGINTIWNTRNKKLCKLGLDISLEEIFVDQYNVCVKYLPTINNTVEFIVQCPAMYGDIVKGFCDGNTGSANFDDHNRQCYFHRYAICHTKIDSLIKELSAYKVFS